MSPAGGHTEIYADPKPRDEDTFRILLCKGGVKQGAVNPPTIPYTDMGMDQAVYHPGRGTVFAVRGGYLFEFAAGSDSTLVQQKRYAVPGIGDASIAYDSGTDRLYVAYWNDPANGVPGPDTAANQGLYKVVPGTLAVESFTNSSTLDGSTNYTPAYSGPRRIISSLSRVYGGITGGGGNNQGTRPFWYKPADGTSVVDGSFVDYNVGGWHSMALNALDVAGQTMWIVQCDESVVYFCDADNFTRNANVNVGTTIFDMCINPGNGRGYFTTKTGTIIRVNLAHAQLTSLVMPGSSPYILCIRYNPYDGQIYAPDANNNVVFVINPATDTITSTKTGFDSPLDMVFTPTKTFVVQQGLVGLKELV